MTFVFGSLFTMISDELRQTQENLGVQRAVSFNTVSEKKRLSGKIENRQTASLT